MYIYTCANCYVPIAVDLRDQVQKKIDKFLEPPPVKAPKPLPRPDDAPRKKRGGRRYIVICVQLHVCAKLTWYSAVGGNVKQ